MMTTAEFLSHIRDLGINLWVEDDDLYYSAPRGALTQDLCAELVERKPEILAFLCEMDGGGDLIIALHPADEDGTESETTFVAPRTSTEETLASIWSEVLGVEQVDIRDNFFELGGDSIMIIRVISRARQAGLELVPRQALECQTIADLAAVADTSVQTITGLREARSLEELGELPDKGALLAQLPREKARGPKLAPLSFAQERLWFLEQLTPGSVDKIMSTIRFDDRLDVLMLEQSLNEIVRRHETLRTVFMIVDDQPVQVINPPEPLALPLVDLCHLAVAVREVEAQRLAHAQVQRRFDLAKDSLFQATLLRLDAEEHILLLNTHHIISDGWSMGVLRQELLTLYRAFSAGGTSPLPDLPIQYADFARWQRKRLQGEMLEEQLSYWRQQLDNAPPVLELPTDRPRPPIQTFRGARQSVQLSKSLSEALMALSQQEQVTLFMTVLAAFQVLLYRYSEQEDISVGTFIANRRFSELEGLIGLLINPFALRTDLSGSPTFRELLRRVREVTLGAYAHSDLPFEELLNALQPARDPSYAPLFQVMLVFQSLPGLDAGLSKSTKPASAAVQGPEYVDYALSLFLWKSDAGITGVVKYSTDLFDASTIARMMGHFQTLLEGIVANPGQRLSELPLLTETEREQLLKQWNRTGVDYARDVRVPDLFQKQVSKTPEKVSVAGYQKELTFRQLDEQTGQLARFLRKLNCDQE